MSRATVPQEIQASVLLKSRRRCCICFGLNRDTSIKQGQIAHLDKDPNNNSIKNLAFLCFDHHDQYDSSTRQSKNFTKLEVIKFEEELITSIEQAFSSPVSFGEVETTHENRILGHYIRDGEFDSAEIKVKLLPDGTYHLEGLALYGEHREIGPNLGDLDFVGELHENIIVYEYKYGNPDVEPYKASFIFENGRLIINEENWVGMFGMNVNFGGTYHKNT